MLPLCLRHWGAQVSLCDFVGVPEQDPGGGAGVLQRDQRRHEPGSLRGCYVPCVRSAVSNSSRLIHISL